ncbi:MAG: hypothetical protein JWR26_1296 [Pedosphaera sp.]|nr:hypothetical protein [Pedosphaera sp.]
MKKPGLNEPKIRATVESRSAIHRYGFALAATAAAFVVRYYFDPIMKDRYPFSMVTFTVTLVAWYAGFVPSLLTFVMGFLLANWFFVPPRHSLALSDSTHAVGNISFLFVALSIIFFSRSMHAARQRADANAREAIAHQKQLEAEVAERKRAEEEIRRLNLELERRVEMRTAELVATNEELESFTYSVSHDLRAPLRHVDAYAQLLEEEFGAQMPADARKFTSKIRKGSQNMGQLVDDLLNLSRIGKLALTMQRTELNPLIESVVADMKLEAPGRRVEWQVGELPLVDCDTGLTRQVFVNLLSNALKYTRTRETARIEVGQMKVDGETAIYVKDNGVGFNMKYAGKLFGVFQRLHRVEEFEGTGVGLATVSRIVRKHGGRIWVEAELDKGATFFLTLEGLGAKAAAIKNGHGQPVSASDLRVEVGPAGGALEGSGSLLG